MTARGARRGFTVVEFLVVATVIGVLVGAGMHFLLDRDRRQVQATAFEDAGKVFEVTCSTAEQVNAGETVKLSAEVMNPTMHDLDFALCERGNCWLELEDAAGARRFVWAEPVHDRVVWEADDHPNVKTARRGRESTFRVALISLAAFGRGRGQIELELTHPPRGDWTARLWLDVCGYHEGLVPSDARSDHFLRSDYFPLLITERE